MKSATKISVSAAAVEKMARRAFAAEPSEVTKLEDGSFNSVYRLRIPGGRRVILKIAPGEGTQVMRYEKSLMESEVAALEKIAKFKYVPVPQVLFYDRTRELVAADYLFMELLPGVPFCNVSESLHLSECSELFTQVGIYAHKINSITGDYFGSLTDPEKRFDSWGDAFYSMVDGLLLDAADTGLALPVDPDRVRERIASEKPLLDEVKKPSLLHGDLWTGNILVNTQSVEITGIVDCERASFGDALMEPVCALMDGEENFVCSYTSGRGFDRTERLRMALYRLYLGILMRTECAFRHYPDDSVASFAEGCISEGLKAYGACKGEPF